MKLERLTELINMKYDNYDLKETPEYEIAIWSTILKGNEVPIKSLSAVLENHSGQLESLGVLKGQLLITDKRILFFLHDENNEESTGSAGLLELYYSEIDNFYTKVNENNKSEVSVVIEVGQGRYTLQRVTRFGIGRWEEYVNDKMTE